MSSPSPLPDRERATLLLRDACEGKAEATVELGPVLYDELKRVARHLLHGERKDHTLQATALVHEAWVRLVDVDGLSDDEAETAHQRFVAMAATSMRRILIDHARRRRADKRGGEELSRVTLHDDLPVAQADDATLLDLESAMVKLGELNERLAQVAELRLFGGLTMPELAKVAGLSLTTAKQDWAFARAMLGRFLDEVA